MSRYICIHGHFYQPPRENPWLEAIELQDSAYPYHDWNERITAECYRPNGAARILNSDGEIERIVNNYSRISFNFGPTLLEWLEEKAPDVYEAILEADRKSLERFRGHGSALAQVYNHLIMPLANHRDKETQVAWGIADFRHRFGRDPEGMWLSETAVDLETLDLLVDHDIRFTILSPYQAGEIRKAGQKSWVDARGGRIDPKTPYRQKLPSGREIVVFFYDGPISRGIAFEKLLSRGEDLAHRLQGAFSSDPDRPELVHIATDGETYGHHHRHGEMGLAYALREIASQDGVELTNYGAFLAEQGGDLPEVKIVENTSWSCVHGVERWKSNCGCNSGRPGWHQEWRAPLREALDWLRDEISPLYEEAAAELVREPWKVRSAYVDVILDRSKETLNDFVGAHARRSLSREEQIRFFKLLELQRHAMLMYTSCGWFFDDLSGIETVQVIQYAGRAVQLADELFEIEGLEQDFLQRLEKAKSNLPEHGNGKRIYEKWVRPARVELAKVGAHYAASSLFEGYEGREEVYAFVIDQRDYEILEAGRTRMALGRSVVTSAVTLETTDLAFACIHLGDHNLAGGIGIYPGRSGYVAMKRELTDSFSRSDIPQLLRRLDRHFTRHRFSLKTLFRDEQRRILNLILKSSERDAESAYRQLFEQHGPLMSFLEELGTPIPTPFRTAAEVVLSSDLTRALLEEELDIAHIQGLLAKVQTWQAQLDRAGLSYALEQILAKRSLQVREQPRNLQRLERLEKAVDLAAIFPFEIDLSQTQNVIYRVLQESLAGGKGSVRTTPLSPADRRLKELARKVSIHID